LGYLNVSHNERLCEAADLQDDREFPTLKASYRQFFDEVAKFKQVIPIRDANIRSKIHQLFRVQYLRDVVLSRMLDDGTFGILNGFIFFTQVDIINFIQNDPSFLLDLLSGFKANRPTHPPDHNEPLDETKRDIILLLNQLMILGKGVQLPSRLALYRNLLEKGLLFAVEWALRRAEAQILHAGAEILTMVVDLDVSAVRVQVLREEETKKRTLVSEMISLLGSTKNMGLLSQVGDALRNLLDTSAEEGVSLQKRPGLVASSSSSLFCNAKRARYPRTSSLSSTRILSGNYTSRYWTCRKSNEILVRP
jgi:protein phosphatase-4 regulatory subunit 3